MNTVSKSLRSPLFVFGLIVTVLFGLGILGGLGVISSSSNLFLLMLPVFSLWMIGASVAGIPGILVTVLAPFIFGIWCMRRALRRIAEDSVSATDATKTTGTSS